MLDGMQARQGIAVFVQALVRLAAQGLRRDGVLYMVANRHLPYEAILGKVLGKVRALAVTPGFKVLSAWR